jgi:hypothetical protein
VSLEYDLADVHTPKQVRAAKEWVGKILDELGVMSGLPTTSRTFVVHHVFVLARDIQDVERTKEKWARLHAADAPQASELRKLRRKLRALEQAAIAFYSAAEGIERDGSRGTRRVANIDTATLEQLMEVIGVLDVPYLTRRTKSRPIQIFVGGRKSTIVKLFNHFVNRCGVRRNDASQRIAKIANRLWGEMLALTDPNSHTPNRAPAILKVVKREGKRRTSR